MLEWIVFGVCCAVLALVLFVLLFVKFAQWSGERRRRHFPPGPTVIGQVYDLSGVPPHERGRHTTVYDLIKQRLEYDARQRAEQFWRDEEQHQAAIGEQIWQAAHGQRAASPYTPAVPPANFRPKA